jgi:hypothetical protein
MRPESGKGLRAVGRPEGVVNGSWPDGNVCVAGELNSIRVRRFAPRMGKLGEGVTTPIRGLRSESDDSIFGVVELQSVPGVGEFPSIRVRYCARWSGMADEG